MFEFLSQCSFVVVHTGGRVLFQSFMNFASSIISSMILPTITAFSAYKLFSRFCVKKH